MVKILQKNEKVLRTKAKPVALLDIQTPKIQKILGDMSMALETQKDGVAIAAPQIGIPLRIFVVSKRYFAWKEGVKEGDEVRIASYKDKEFINPEIVKLSKKIVLEPEGCLSVRWLYGKVSRSLKARVRALDKNGNTFEMGGSGLLAQIFQHEIDHLEGVLFTDTAKDLREMKRKQ